MAHVISFRSARFDVSKEPPNPANPIAGASVLNWLREELAKGGLRTTEPATEDWGWYIDVEAGGASYLVGASTDAEGDEADRDWVVQIHKTRSMTDRLFGRNAMAADDPVTALIERLVRSDGGIHDVSVERDG